MLLDIKILNFLGREYYTYLTIKLVEEVNMEERVIKRIRVNKRRLFKLYKLIINNIDVESEMIDSESLLTLEIISKINEELTDIIYMILDNKKS